MMNVLAVEQIQVFAVVMVVYVLFVLDVRNVAQPTQRYRDVIVVTRLAVLVHQVHVMIVENV